jgi:hypothetical protein
VGVEEFLGVDAVLAFHFAVEPRCGRSDVDVADALVQDVPVEGGLELSAVVGLDTVGYRNCSNGRI